jgi:lysophospholipase L1-like esterase
MKRDSRLLYVDIATPMLGEDGKPRSELFAPDGLHLNAKGYELWASILRPMLR